LKPITVEPVGNVGNLCNLIRPRNVLALTAVTIEAPSENGNGSKMVTLQSPTLFVDAQLRAILIQQGQCFGIDTTILGYSLILYDPTGSRVYQEKWRRSGTGVLEPFRDFANPKAVIRLPYKSYQIKAWRPWLQRLLINGRLPTWYANGNLPEWLAFGELPIELAQAVNDAEHQRWFRRARFRARNGVVR